MENSCLTRLFSSLGSLLVSVCVMVMLLSSTSGAGMQILPEEAVAVQPSVHTLVVNAFVDISCRQQCFLLLHALENEQTGGGLESPVQLQGNATLLQVNTVTLSQLPAGTYGLTVSCSEASLCISEPPNLHFFRLPSGTVATSGNHAAADASLPQVQVLESSFRVVHGHGIANKIKEHSHERSAWGKKWLQGILAFCLMALQVSGLVLS